MFDASYFKSVLDGQITAVGGKATVEVHLTNAHTHRVRGIVAAESNYVTFEAYRQRVDGGRCEQHWQAAAPEGEAVGDTSHVVVAYDKIVEIVITPVEESSTPRIGFIRE